MDLNCRQFDFANSTLADQNPRAAPKWRVTEEAVNPLSPCYDVRPEFPDTRDDNIESYRY